MIMIMFTVGRCVSSTDGTGTTKVDIAQLVKSRRPKGSRAAGDDGVSTRSGCNHRRRRLRPKGGEDVGPGREDLGGREGHAFLRRLVHV